MNYSSINLLSSIIDSKNIKSSVMQALEDFAVQDNDFNGENGWVFLNDDAEEAGYETNLEYALSRFQEDNDLCLEEKIDNFFDYWMGHDSYYECYNFSLIYNNSEEPIALVLAFTTN